MKTSKIILILPLLIFNSCSKTSLSDNVYIEKDKQNNQRIVHTSSSCSNIKNGYIVENIKDFYYFKYQTAFCSNCCYESDVIVLQNVHH